MRNLKRTIVVKFFNFKDKSKILNREKKPWKEKLFVHEDFLEDTTNICKGLLQKAKDLRSQNNVAKVYEKERGNDISEAQEYL